MRVRDAMSHDIEYVSPTMSLAAAAQKMIELDTGFLPVGDTAENRLQGVITDRDIVVRAVADGKDPKQTAVKEAQSQNVLYCFEDDSVEDAAESMRRQQVYRLIVLDSRESKRLKGVVSLGDLVRHDREHLGGEAARDISAGHVTH